jgi:diketogulonate reductase-like aldo/keto reductase
VTAAQLALAWVIRSRQEPGMQVVAIPKSSHPARIDENLGACDIVLNQQILQQIDALFPPPSRKISLAMV